MKKYFFPRKGNFYKANLHCHTTVSDGKFTPEEIKKFYCEKGYSIVAFTDHEVMIPHGELSDDSFLALDGYEIEIREEGDDFPSKLACHLCFVATREGLDQVCWYRSKYLHHGNAQLYKDKVKFDESLADFEREYSPECINEMIRLGKEGGFFVTYNHPTWSMERYPQYMCYEGLDAMEIVNNGSAVIGFDDYNPRVYDDMLYGGKRLYCVATDDTHKKEDLFGGFVMIKAEALEYGSVTRALLNGDFYSSQGPEIKEIWFEDNSVYVEAPDAETVNFVTARRTWRYTTPVEKDNKTCFRFSVSEADRFVRITATDKYGKHANTNAYFFDELGLFENNIPCLS